MLLEKDRRRIEEERAGIARPAPATLGPSHLAQALDAFDDACTPEVTLTPRRRWPLDPGDPPAAWRTLAEITQRTFCCAATLFTAFAAEAFVNDFLSVHLQPEVPEKKFREIDRHWSTARKYTEAVEMAYGRLFWKDDEVMPSLKELFDVRHSLVHGRPGAGPPMAHLPDPCWRALYPPRKVSEWLVAVAGAAESLEMRCYGFDYVSTPATAIWRGREIVREYGSQAEPLPNASQMGRSPLIEQLYDHLKRQDEARGSLRLTTEELRDARLGLAGETGPWDTFTAMAVRQVVTKQASRTGEPQPRPEDGTQGGPH